MGTLIQGGTLVTAGDMVKGDLWIEDGKIKASGTDLFSFVGPTDQIISAKGKFVFPGMIDQHTHIESTFNKSLTAPWKTETIAAAYGGTTCIIDFAIQHEGETLHEALNQWKGRANQSSAIDYGFHLAISDLRPGILEEIPKIVASGVPSLKLFMAYKGELMISDSDLFNALVKAKECGAVVMVHAENGDLVDLLRQKYYENGNIEPYYHALSRPISAESEATSRAISIAETADAPIFIVHVSGDEPARKVREAKAKGVKVFAETCPHYLLLTEDLLRLPDFEGAKFVCSPPLRTEDDQKALWRALSDTTLETIGSDHCAFNYNGQKELGREDFRKIPNGGNGIEHRMRLLYTYGVQRGRMSLSKMVDLLSTMPAKIHGLYPRKGTIAVGADADLVIYEPSGEEIISQQTSHQGIDYDMFEGIRIEGRVELVFLRGKLIVMNNQYVGDLSDGHYVHRTPFGACYGHNI